MSRVRPYDAVMAGVTVFVPGRVNRTLATLARLLPESLVMAAMTRDGGTVSENIAGTGPGSGRV